MTSPTSGRDDATLRGAVVLVVAIVIGLALLARGGGGGGDDDASDAGAGETTTSSTEFDGSQSTAAPINSVSTTEGSVPSDTRAPEEVTVIVLNGLNTRVDGIAGQNDEKLTTAGYVTLDPGNATTKTATTTVYATPEFQADAEAVRAILGMPDASIEEKPAEPLGPGAERADIVVVLGDDAAGAAGGDTGTDTTDTTSG
jgi:hypothetical protein